MMGTVGRRRVTLLALSVVTVAAGIACGRQGVDPVPTPGPSPHLPIGFGVTLLPTSTPVSHWVAGWNHRKTITINAGQVPAPQLNFPVLINLSADADLLASAR